MLVRKMKQEKEVQHVYLVGAQLEQALKNDAENQSELWAAVLK